MSAAVRYACEKSGCGYIAEGATKRQALARMSRHWTARDHEEYVRSILAEGECDVDG